MPSTTSLEIPPEEQGQMRAVLRRTRYGYLLAFHILLLCAAGRKSDGYCGLPVLLALQRVPYCAGVSRPGAWASGLTTRVSSPSLSSRLS